MAYEVSGTRFRALRARGGREAKIFSMENLFCRDDSNEVSHAGLRSVFLFRTQAGRQADRPVEEILRKYIL